MTPQVFSLNPADNDAWDKLALRFDAATIFHSARWARVMHASYGHEPHLLALMDGDKPRALLPLLEVRSLLKGRRSVSMPFSDEGGMLCAEGEDGRTLWDHAVGLGRQRGWKHVEVRAPLRCHPDAAASANFIGHEIDLSGGDEAIFERFESSVRRAIRKAEKSQVTVQVLRTVDAVRTYHELHCRTRRKHGVPPQSLAFFENIFTHVIQHGAGFVAEARHEGQPVAAGVFLHFGGMAIYKFGASDESKLHLRANDMVMWTAMKTCATLGCRAFSMGRTDADNAGLRRFKCGFGAREKPVTYQRFNLQDGTFVSGFAQPGGTLNKAMRFMPMPLFKLAGKILYPQLD